MLAWTIAFIWAISIRCGIGACRGLRGDAVADAAAGGSTWGFCDCHGRQESVRRFIELTALSWAGERLSGKERVEETGKRSSGEVVVRIDPRYFRPAEVETLLGDPPKRRRSCWTPTTTLEELVAEMVAMTRRRRRRSLFEAEGSMWWVQWKIHRPTPKRSRLRGAKCEQFIARRPLLLPVRGAWQAAPFAGQCRRMATVMKRKALLTPTRQELDLLDAEAVKRWYEEYKPDVVVLAAAKVGGIVANDTYPADFLLENLKIQTNVIEGAWKAGARRLLFLGSSCIYPKFAEQPIREEALLTGALEPTNEWYAIAKITGIKCESLSSNTALMRSVDAYEFVWPWR